MIDKDRIRLAEFVGFVPDKVAHHIWYRPGKKKPYTLRELPDPFTDANDCEVLIRHLDSLGWCVTIHWLDGVALVSAWHKARAIEPIRYDDWKQGVCELALEVLEDKS